MTQDLVLYETDAKVGFVIVFPGIKERAKIPGGLKFSYLNRI